MELIDCRRAGLAVVLAWCAAAGATDVTQAPLPSALPDRQLAIGERALSLPEGQWQLVSRAEGHVTMSGISARDAHFTVYAMDTQQQRFRGGVVLRLPVASSVIANWRDEPCKGNDNALLKDDFGNDFKFPQCLLVHKRRSHLTAGNDKFFTPARDWAVANGVAPAGGVYEVAFHRYAPNEFGWVRVFLPAESFASDAEAIAWARQLPEALGPFFEKRVTQAALPAFPRKDR